MRLPEPDTLAAKAAWSAWTAGRAPLEWGVPFLPPRVLRRIQAARIRSAVEHAYRHVPFYAETMRRLGLTPADVRDASGLRRLPVVEREMLSADPERFLSRHLPRASMLERRSGGSVGTPLLWLHTPSELFHDAVLRERHRFVQMRMVGRLRLRTTYIDFSDKVAQADAPREFRRRSLLRPGLRLERQTLSLMDDPAVNARHIDAFAPDVLAAYGSCIETLFVHALLSGTPVHRPKLAVYGFDHMSQPGRRLVEGHFGVPVRTVYGATESRNIAFSCEHDTLHVNSDVNALRVVDDAGRDAAPGERGEVLVSTLLARGTMAFNLRLGDVAAADPGRCRCGRSLPALAGLLGRRGSRLEDTAGRPLYADDLGSLAAQRDEVLRYQVAQTEHGALRLAVVVSPGADREAVATGLRRTFARRLGDDVRVEVTFVEDLPRTPHGKLLPLVRV